jgi:hypothetical protein
MKLAALCLVFGAFATTAHAFQIPFPTDKTTTLREDGQRYLVEGRVKVPNSVTISSLRATRIEGRGDEAVLEVSGALEFKAVTGGEVVFENVWIELAPDCKSLYMAGCKFSNCGIRTAEGKPTSATIFGENNWFENSASLQIHVAAADIAIHGGSSRRPILIHGDPISDKAANRSKLFMLSWNGQANGKQKGCLGGITVEGLADVVVRNVDIRGVNCRFADCAKLEFDGNLVSVEKTEFVQSAYGKFASTRIANSDFKSGKVHLIAPAQGKKAERQLLDHCWFGGPVEPAEITGPLVVDNTVDPSTGVLATYKKTSPTPNGLAGQP